LDLFGTNRRDSTLAVMGIKGHTTAEYRTLASQCLERAGTATTAAERLYFTEQAAMWHRLGEARQATGASGYFAPKKAPPRGSKQQLSR
jgi:hypothetical protein